MKFLKKLFSRKKERKVSGVISVVYTCDEEGENFTLEADINDLSDQSAIALSHIIIGMNNGNIATYLQEALLEWAMDNKKLKNARLQFLRDMAHKGQEIIHNLQNPTQTTNTDQPAVNASDVFKFKR